MRTINAAQTVLARFKALEREVQAEMPPAADPHALLSQHEQRHRQQTERTLRQIQDGFDKEEPTDPRLGDLMREPAVVGLRLRRPCLTTITALLKQLRQEAAAALQPKDVGPPWPRRYRLRTLVQLDKRSKPAPAGPHVHDGRLVLPGEDVLLTEEQAAAWADKFEAVSS